MDIIPEEDMNVEHMLYAAYCVLHTVCCMLYNVLTLSLERRDDFCYHIHYQSIFSDEIMNQ